MGIAADDWHDLGSNVLLNAPHPPGFLALPPGPERGFFRAPLGLRAAAHGLIPAHHMENCPVKEPDDEDLEIQSPPEVGYGVPTLMLYELP